MIALLLAAGLGALTLPGQQRGQTRVSDFKVVDFYEAAGGSRNQLKYLIQGAEARPLTNNLVLVTELRAQHNFADGRTNLIATAPECIVNHAQRELYGPGHLRIQSSDGLYSIEGDGFFCRLTNFSFIISNRVRTVIQRELLPNAQP